MLISFQGKFGSFLRPVISHPPRDIAVLWLPEIGGAKAFLDPVKRVISFNGDTPLEGH
jgi:hypothetical protein